MSWCFVRLLLFCSCLVEFVLYRFESNLVQCEMNGRFDRNAGHLVWIENTRFPIRFSVCCVVFFPHRFSSKIESFEPNVPFLPSSFYLPMFWARLCKKTNVICLKKGKAGIPESCNELILHGNPYFFPYWYESRNCWAFSLYACFSLSDNLAQFSFKSTAFFASFFEFLNWSETNNVNELSGFFGLPKARNSSFNVFFSAANVLLSLKRFRSALMAFFCSGVSLAVYSR